LLGLLDGPFAPPRTEAPLPTPSAEKETVILLHGMGRSRVSLWLLDLRLRQAGYVTHNFPYAPHSRSLDDLSKLLHDFVKKNVDTKSYHLVGHSLGNIIIRNGFNHDGYPPGLGRIVMLAPPNQPAALAQALKDNPLYKLFAGDSGQKLSSKAFYKKLAIPTVEFGVIAGDRGQSLTFSEPNDGIITVASTKLKGMKDWIVLHHSHTFIMNSRDTVTLCINFLKHGRFKSAGSPQRDGRLRR